MKSGTTKEDFTSPTKLLAVFKTAIANLILWYIHKKRITEMPVQTQTKYLKTDSQETEFYVVTPASAA